MLFGILNSLPQIKLRDLRLDRKNLDIFLNQLDSIHHGFKHRWLADFEVALGLKVLNHFRQRYLIGCQDLNVAFWVAFQIVDNGMILFHEQ
jgi:hypothetical protein